MENRPNNTGVVRAIAKLDHCRCLHPEVSTDFLEGDFHLPAQQEPFQDLPGRLMQIGTQQGARSNLPLGSRTNTQRIGKGGRLADGAILRSSAGPGQFLASHLQRQHQHQLQFV